MVESAVTVVVAVASIGYQTRIEFDTIRYYRNCDISKLCIRYPTLLNLLNSCLRIESDMIPYDIIAIAIYRNFVYDIQHLLNLLDSCLRIEFDLIRYYRNCDVYRKFVYDIQHLLNLLNSCLLVERLESRCG